MSRSDYKKKMLLLSIKYPNGEFHCPRCYMDFEMDMDYFGDEEINARHIVLNYELIISRGYCAQCLHDKEKMRISVDNKSLWKRAKAFL